MSDNAARAVAVLATIFFTQACGDPSGVGARHVVQLRFVEQPGDAVAGEVIGPAITVELQNADGHAVPGVTDTVTLALGANPGGAILKGTPTVVTSDGVATFANVWLEAAAAGYTLTATAAGLAPDTSDRFAVAPGPPVLAFLTQPGTAEGQVPFPTVIQVAAREDRFGNVVSGAPVTLTLAGSPWGDALRGATTVAATDGVASFNGLSLAMAGDGLMLEAGSGAAIPVRSAPFAVRLTFTTIAASGGYTCGLTDPGFAYCWGANYGGRLGDGTGANRVAPAPVQSGLTFTQLTAAAGGCGVTANHDAFCWGYNDFGRVGDGTTTARPSPVAVAGGLKFDHVSAGGLHTCGVTLDSLAYCWGSNTYGQLGDGTTTTRLIPTPVAGGLRVSQISAGQWHTCAVSTGNAAYCWGENEAGRLGDSSTTRRPVPTPVWGNLSVTQVSAGGVHTCAVAVGGQAYCWGDDGSGQVGNGEGSTTWTLTPEVVSGSLTFRQISAGGFHTCGVTTANTAFCWGDNLGQLGDGTLTRRHSPSPVAGGLEFAQISAGPVYHSCGMSPERVAYCWGLNDLGQLGDGSTAPHLSPVRIVQ